MHTHKHAPISHASYLYKYILHFLNKISLDSSESGQGLLRRRTKPWSYVCNSHSTYAYALIFTHLTNVLTDIQNCQWTACFPPNPIRWRNYFFFKYWKQLKVHYIKCRIDCLSLLPHLHFCRASFIHHNSAFSFSWIIFHSHYQSYFFSTTLTRILFKICAWLHVLATQWAYQAQPIHSCWVIEWASFLLYYPETTVQSLSCGSFIKSSKRLIWLLISYRLII